MDAIGGARYMPDHDEQAPTQSAERDAAGIGSWIGGRAIVPFKLDRCAPTLHVSESQPRTKRPAIAPICIAVNSNLVARVDK